MPTVLLKPNCLRAAVQGAAVGVDREARILRGYVVAQEGPFKTPGRGEFDEDAIREIVRLGNAAPRGLRSRFTHPGLSEDGLGKFLGRAKGFYLGHATDARTGKRVAAARADLHFADAASRSPEGDLAGYVMDLAEDDPDALSSSLVVEADLEWRVDEKKRPLEDDEGNELPPLWRPVKLLASDIVDTGDAVDGLLSAGLSAGDLPDGAVRLASAALDRAFAGAGREVVEARCLAWLTRYLELRYGPAVAPETPLLNALDARLKAMAAAMARPKGGA